MDIDIGLSKKILNEMIESLNDLLANAYAIYLQTQNYHWNITGPDFYSLHILLEKHYEDLAEGNDEIAERIRTLGGSVDATFTAFGKKSKIAETKPTLSWKKMVEELVTSHETMSKLARPFISRAQEVHDDVSSDLLIKRISFHEKAAWMLRSHLVSK
jgi:starvation-inducible DNA-binding protein